MLCPIGGNGHRNTHAEHRADSIRETIGPHLLKSVKYPIIVQMLQTKGCSDIGQYTSGLEGSHKSRLGTWNRQQGICICFKKTRRERQWRQRLPS